MRVQGKLISVQHNSGSFVPKDGDGTARSWENAEVRVFDGREVVVIKAKRDALPVAMSLLGREGEAVTLDVDSPRTVDTFTFSLVNGSEPTNN